MGLNFIPPISCAGTKEVTIPEISFIGTAGIDIVSKIGANIVINGGIINLPTPLPVTGNSNWEVFRLDTSALTGTIHVLSDEVMNLSVYAASGNKGAAGYFSGFNNAKAPEVSIQSIIGNDSIIEGCEPFIVILGKGGSNLNLAQTFFINIGGTATNGVDYNMIPDSLIIPAGKDKDTLNISAFVDNLVENNESIIITITFTGVCGDSIVVSDTLIIGDYTTMTSIVSDDQNICREFNETGSLSVNVENGVPPYAYLWSSIFSPNSTVQVSPEVTTTYAASITDACGFTIVSDSVTIFVQCPLTAPNIITPNGDGKNDVLVFSNLEDFDDSHLVVFNRWGNIVYETDNYNNDWGGTKNGKKLSDGVYYFVLTPYNTVEPKPDFPLELIKGYIHILR